MTGWEPRLTASEQAGPLTLAATDVRHPIFRPFGALSANLGQARFDRAWRVAPEGWTVIARFSNGTPALLERSAGQGRVVLFASDIDRRWNDFPLQPAFVPFALETLRYAAGDRHRTQDFTVAQAPAGARRAPGVYRSTDNRAYAVTVDTRESTIDPMPAADFAQMVPPSTEMYAQAAERQARQTESRVEDCRPGRSVRRCRRPWRSRQEPSFGRSRYGRSRGRDRHRPHQRRPGRTYKPCRSSTRMRYTSRAWRHIIGIPSIVCWSRRLIWKTWPSSRGTGNWSPTVYGSSGLLNEGQRRVSVILW